MYVTLLDVESLAESEGGWVLVGLDVRGTSADFLEYYRSEFEW